jgi:uncharacterized protein YhaN
MRIAALQIERFGIFRDLPGTQLPPGMVLVQGDNEAGKSTLLWFIRGVLFGFPYGHSHDPRYTLDDSGTHGGRLDIVTDAGEAYSITRHGVRSGGSVTVSDGQGVECGEAALQRLLGTTTARLYRNVYAFSLAELHAIDTLQAKEVKSAIYGASAGVALLALPQALQRIHASRDELFRPRGQRQQINQRLARLDTIRDQLRSAMREADRYDQACLRLAQAEREIEAARHDLAQLRSEAAKVASYLQLWPDWVQLQELTAKLHGLPLVVETFPDNGLANLETEQRVLAENDARLHELEDQLAATRREIEGLDVDARLSEQSEAIAALVESRRQYVSAREDLPTRRQERSAVDVRIREVLDGLGPEWTEDKVRHADRSLSAREAIRQHGQQLDSARAQLAAAEQDAASRQDTHENMLREERAAQRRLEEIGDLELPDEQLLSALRSRREVFRNATESLKQDTAEQANARKRLEQAIHEIDPGWNEEDVRRFDVSVAAQRRIQKFAQDLDDLRQRRGRAEARRQGLAEMLGASEEQLPRRPTRRRWISASAP